MDLEWEVRKWCRRRIHQCLCRSLMNVHSRSLVVVKEVEEEDLLHRLRLVVLEEWNDWVSGD